MANYPFVMLPAQLFSEDLAGSDFKVIGVLARHTNNDRICHVFVRTIEKETGVSRQQVFKSLRKLEDLGYIRRQNDYNKTFQANYYFIDFNPQPSREMATNLVAENTLPSREMAIHNEQDLKELYINSKNLNKRSAQFSKKEVEEGQKIEITPEDKQILSEMQDLFDDVAIWNKLYKTKNGLFLKPVSSLGARNTEPERVDDLITHIYDNYGVMIHAVPANSNDNGACEVK